MAEPSSEVRVSKERIRKIYLLQRICLIASDIFFFSIFTVSWYLSFNHRLAFFYYYACTLIFFGSFLVLGFISLTLAMKYSKTKEYLAPRGVGMIVNSVIVCIFISAYYAFIMQLEVLMEGIGNGFIVTDLANYIPKGIRFIKIFNVICIAEVFIQGCVVYMLVRIHDQKMKGFCPILKKDVPRMVFLKN